MLGEILKPRKKNLEDHLQGDLLYKVSAVKVLVFISQNKEDKQLLQVYLIYQSNQSKMNTCTKFGNI